MSALEVMKLARMPDSSKRRYRGPHYLHSLSAIRQIACGYQTTFRY